MAALAAFYERLGFEPRFTLPGPDGTPGFISLAREGAELGVVTEESPRELAGVEPGPGPRHELFVYVEALDAVFAELAQPPARPVREPADMPWGERIAYLADPEGNLVVLASRPGG